MKTIDKEQHIPVTPSVLCWARETAGLSTEDVAAKLGRKTITPAVIEAWECGQGAPTYSQLEHLAYDVYKRPLALFFFPEPPEEKTPQQAFRTLPEQEIQIIPARVRFLLRQAELRQIYLAELQAGDTEPAQSILRDVPVDLRLSAADAASRVRQYLGISLEMQSSWKNVDEALKNWRDAVENAGVFVFKDAFHDDSISGFCLHDERYPVIYINNSKPHTRQIFTLFHELAHLLFGLGGIDKPIEGYIEYLSGADKQIELFCNQFTSELLVPESDFAGRVADLSVFDGRTIETLANYYHVSREVVLRRLLDMHKISQKAYSQYVAEWKGRAQGASGGGNYYSTQGVYLSKRYVELAFSQRYRRNITSEQLSNYLGVKPTNLPRLEVSLASQGVLA